jgi:gluconolactonase
VPTAEIVSDQLPFGEGPVWCPDGTVVCVSVSHGELRRIDPETGTTTVIAATAGGPNGAALASDGSFLVTQNGGIDFKALGHIENPPEMRPVRSGIQRVWPDGRVETVPTPPMHKPNDLVVAQDGTVYFTDPDTFPGSPDRVARVVALRTDGTTDVVADGFVYTNGIGIDPNGTSLVVIEDEGLLRLHDLGRGDHEWLVPARGAADAWGDGFCLDVEGRYYVGSKAGNGIRVVEPDGTEVDFLGLPGTGFVTNCCFGAVDRRTLFATESRGGRLVAWEGMPSTGLPVHEWPAPPAGAS